MPARWERVTLGRSGVSVMPLGLGSSFGVGQRDVERAIERGVSYLYWGSIQRPGFGAAIRHAARRRRESVVTVIQTYTRVASLMRPSLEQALLRLRLDHTDFLLLGWWNDAPPRRMPGVSAAALAATPLPLTVLFSIVFEPELVRASMPQPPLPAIRLPRTVALPPVVIVRPSPVGAVWPLSRSSLPVIVQPDAFERPMPLPAAKPTSEPVTVTFATLSPRT